MKARIGLVAFPILGFAACGGGAEQVSIRGDFADSAAAASVRAVEAARDAEVKGGAFALGGLSAGPATLRLIQGADTSATLALDNAPAGAAIVLHGLRTDPRSHRAFPRSVELTGTDLLLVNGVRMGADALVPADVDAHGSILALSDERDALLVRPDDAALPDLRVVVGLGTRVVGADGSEADASSLARGDSVRVQGRADHGFVVADRLTVGQHLAATPAPRADPAVSEPRAATAPVPAPTPPAPVVFPSELRRVGPVPVREVRGHGGGRGRGHGRGKRH